MEILDVASTGKVTEEAGWGEAPPPRLDEEELDILAFELWQRGSRQDPAAGEDCSNDEEVVASHASCL